MLLNEDKAHRVFNRLIEMDNLKYHTPDGWNENCAMLSDCVTLHNIASKPLNIQVIHCDNDIRAFIVQCEFIEREPWLDFSTDGILIRETNSIVLKREFYYKDSLVTHNLAHLYGDYIRRDIDGTYIF